MRKIESILFITLSNIGDCVLTLPALDVLKAAYPQARITVLSGPRPRELFENNPAVARHLIYEKHAPLKEKLRFFSGLCAEKFDMVADMRNSLLGMILPGAVKKIRLPFGGPKGHMRGVHLAKLPVPFAASARVSLSVNTQTASFIENMLRQCGIGRNERFFVLCPGSRSEIKRWPKERYSALADKLSEIYGAKIVLTGDESDIPVNKFISKNCGDSVADLTGRTSLVQTFALIKAAALVVTNDSANLHLAGYADTPAVAVFGPTDEKKYGPWSSRSAVAKKDISCRPCMKAQCVFGSLACMDLVSVEDVLDLCAGVLGGIESGCPGGDLPERFKRILVVRTDRIGDLILSTPVLKALRRSYPSSFLSVMVRPYTKAVVEGNPYVDEVIVYDKRQRERTPAGFFSFIGFLRKKRFDLAVVLHPTVRDHLIVFLAGIPKRLGYDRKMGVLLTDKVKFEKNEGLKHESEYALDVLRALGIDPRQREFYVPRSESADRWVKDFFRVNGIKPGEKIVALNPGASCRSKIWPPERYAAVADALAATGCRIIVVAGPEALDSETARRVISLMRSPAVDCVGKAPVPETVSLFRACSLVISADTGPMHIASAAGVPLVAIFGRNQPGISPVRWGPVNPDSVVLHKNAGCGDCSAHMCKKNFACLRAITEDEVIEAAKNLLKK